MYAFTVQSAAGMNRGNRSKSEFNERAITLTAKGYVKEQAACGKPFFLCFAQRNVHTPLMPRPRFEKTGEIGVYGSFINELDRSPGWRLSGPRGEAGERASKAWKCAAG
jgi:hypothetical protein